MPLLAQYSAYDSGDTHLHNAENLETTIKIFEESAYLPQTYEIKEDEDKDSRLKLARLQQ
jgi:hypothetical protein